MCGLGILSSNLVPCSTQAPPHRRRVLRHGVPAHAVHGAPRVPAEEAGQPVRAAPLRLQDPPARLPDPAAGGGQLQGAHEDDDVQQREEIIIMITTTKEEKLNRSIVSREENNGTEQRHMMM